MEMKTEMQKKMAHWRHSWRDAVTEWANKIRILPPPLATGCTNELEMVALSADVGCHLMVLMEGKKYTLDHALEYFKDQGKKYLSVVPVNLFVSVYSHLVTSFGANYEHYSRKGFADVHNIHYLWAGVGDDYKRNRAAILQSSPDRFADQSADHALSSTTLLSDEKFDGWEKVLLQGFQQDNELKMSTYICGLLAKLKTYQMNKMIEHHFSATGLPGTAEIITEAKEIANRLIVTVGKLSAWGIGMTGNHGNLDNSDNICLFLLDGNKDREIMKANLIPGNDKWEYYHHATNNPDFAKELKSLTLEDFTFIVRCFIDGKHDGTKILAASHQIDYQDERQVDGSISFPGLNDDFSSFDPVRLRGLLGEIVLSKKLKAYALSMEEIHEIRAGNFAEIAPTALTHIVGSYYPVDLPDAQMSTVESK